jgi:methyltransferase (TIGR00027 family)
MKPMRSRGVDRRGFLFRLAAGAGSAGLAQFGVSSTVLAAARMDSGAPSETALGAAKLRAVHQILEYPRVLHDPFALPILGLHGEAELRAALPQYQQPFPRAMRASMVLRSRYADDRFYAATRRGVRQYVVLGAGLDTFAYRNQYPEAMLKVYEVDHPATQAWKRSRLREMGISIPASLRFAPVDFERQSLGEELARAGFRRDQPAFFSWLGVSMYLTEPAVMQTLRYIASLAPSSEVVFDYMVPAHTLARQSSRSAAAAYVAKLGEPWITFFEPRELAERLKAAGFAQNTLFGAQDANLAYFSGRTDGFRVNGSHLAAALV